MPNGYNTGYIFKFFFSFVPVSDSFVLLSFLLPGKQNCLFAYTDLSKSMGERVAGGQDPECMALFCISFWSHVNKWWDAGSLEA